MQKMLFFTTLFLVVVLLSTQVRAQEQCSAVLKDIHNEYLAANTVVSQQLYVRYFSSLTDETAFEEYQDKHKVKDDYGAKFKALIPLDNGAPPIPIEGEQNYNRDRSYEIFKQKYHSWKQSINEQVTRINNYNESNYFKQSQINNRSIEAWENCMSNPARSNHGLFVYASRSDANTIMLKVFFRTDGIQFVKLEFEAPDGITVKAKPDEQIHGTKVFKVTGNVKGEFSISVNGEIIDGAGKNVENIASFDVQVGPVLSAVVTPVVPPPSAELCIPVPLGLIAWYRGEEDDKAIDSSGNNYNGQLDGLVGFTQKGKIGSAFKFDGEDDRIVISAAPDNIITTELTIDLWLQPTKTGRQIIFVSKYDNRDPQNSFFLGTDETGSKIKFVIYQGGGSGANMRGIESTRGILPDLVFTHIAATFSAKTQEIKIYMNGKIISSNNIFDNNVSSVYGRKIPIRLGEFRDGTGDHAGLYKGLMDEVHIFNRSLSESEIQTIYNSSKGICTQ